MASLRGIISLRKRNAGTKNVRFSAAVNSRPRDSSEGAGNRENVVPFFRIGFRRDPEIVEARAPKKEAGSTRQIGAFKVDRARSGLIVARRCSAILAAAKSRCKLCARERRLEKLVERQIGRKDW